MLGRQRPRGLSISLALCAFLAALSGACKSSDPRTQVMLVIEADDEVRARATELIVEFESRSEFDHVDGAPYEQTFPTVEGAEPFWPYSIALVPRGNDARRSYRIEATLYEGENPIAVLRARSGFVAQRTLELKLLFSADCLDKKSLSCSEQETCYEGECWSSDVDVLSLPGLGSDGNITAADGGMTTSSETRTGTQRRADGGTSGEGGSSGPGRRGAGGTSGNNAVDGGTPDKPERIIGGNCGDGVWNDEEECDTMIPQGLPGACDSPESCRTGGCKPEQLEGTACKTRCMEYPVQSAIAGDDCCPDGTDSSTDPDCTVATCGNGVVEMGELCDGDCPVDPAACPRSNDCQTATIVGDAASCSAVCAMSQIDVCMTGDGCCGTSDCNNTNDGECSPGCGNGVVEEALGELCEPTSADGPCPSCDDGDPCTDDITTGTPENCNVRCNHTPVTRTVNGDMCCPSGRGNANNDSDCPAICGNGLIERGEFCDGLCPTAASQCEDFIACTRSTLVASPCGMRCSFELILAAANGDGCCPVGATARNDNDCTPDCGNLVIEPGEVCDGNCPTSCPADTDGNACTANVVAGTGCSRRCDSRPVLANLNGPDGCCPSNANSNTDSDCQPTCNGTQMLCGGRCVEINTNANCARCGDVCPPEQMCSSRTCVDRPPGCPSPNEMCGTACVPLGTNANCARCGDDCRGDLTCLGTSCGCASGTACGTSCCESGQVCTNGMCGDPPPVCSSPNKMCGTACVPLGTNANCADCGDDCRGDLTCVGTSCGCASGTACGTSCCGSGQVCTNGMCGDPPPVCSSPNKMCGTACVPLGTNANCSDCGDDCRGDLTCLGTSCGCASGTACGTSCCGSGQVCTNSVCVDPPPVCSSPNRMCGTACVPLGTNANCADCGDDCRGELTCLGSSCGCASGTRCGTSCCGSGQICNGTSCENPPPDPMPEPDPTPEPPAM